MDRYFKLLRQNTLLYALPISYDLLSFFLGTFLMGFWGASTLSIKLALQPGLPSVAPILEHNVLANGISLTHPQGGFVFLTFLFLLLVGAFLQAGYIGWLLEVTRGNKLSRGIFLSSGWRFWLRMLMVSLFLLMLSFMGLFAAEHLGGYGVVLVMLGIASFRVCFIFWEFTIVAENLSAGDGFFRCLQYFRRQTPATVWIIGYLLLLGLGFGLFVNFIWHPITVFATIFAYNFSAAGLQLALMHSFMQIEIQEF
jgi:hypothetical protein